MFYIENITTSLTKRFFVRKVIIFLYGQVLKLT